MLDPVGFWSYARHDDAHSDGQLSQLRVIVGKAIGLQHGAEVTLWQDIAAISYGADWAETIERTLGQTTFFMPIVTPRFLKSQNCLEEYISFRRRMADLGRNDLVFPVHYVGVDDVKEAETVFGDDLARLRGHQWIDFRPLFYADPRSPEVRRWAGGLAASILKALRKEGGTPARTFSRTIVRPAVAARDSARAPDVDEQGRLRAPDDEPSPALLREAVTHPPQDSADAEPAEGPRLASAVGQSPPPSGRSPPASRRAIAIVSVLGVCAVLAAVVLAAVVLPRLVSPSRPAATTAGSTVEAPKVAEAITSKVAEAELPNVADAVKAKITQAELPPLAVDGGIPVQVGDTAVQVMSAFHTQTTPTQMGTSSDYVRERTMLRLNDLGIWFFFDPAGKLYDIRFDAPWTGSVAGIRIGDTQAKVEADLGPAKTGTPSQGSGSYYYDRRYIYRKAGTFIASFDFDSSNRVETIMVP